MSVRIGKAEVRLSIGVLPLFATLIVAGEGMTLILSLLSLLLHECAHAIAARNLGFSVRRVSLWPFGAVMGLEPVSAVPDSEWIVSLAGPLSSLAIASAARLLAHTAPALSKTLEPFIHTNAALALFNLLPAYPLDGGRIAKSLFLRCMEERAARRVTFAFSALIALFTLAAGVWCVRRGMPAWTLFMIAPYLLISAAIEWKRAEPNAVAHVLERRTAQNTGSAIRAQIMVIGANATIGTAMQTLSHRRFTILKIRSGTRTVEADEDALLDAASRYGYGSTLKDAFMR